MASMYEQLIITGLLLCQPSNYTAALERRAARAVPRDVQRAIDYMQGHLDAPITLADIVRVSGIPGRTLLKHFRDHHGVSPMRYLRDARLARVREALTRAGPADSVTAIALTWGFSHLGRFAIEYRARFGESPSDTCRRSRTSQG
jgi:transcriptional regulator GlxA family with amidase domain